MSTSFLAAASTRTADAALMPDSARPTLGGREVNSTGINCGVLRCPRCSSRLVSAGRGKLTELHGADADLWRPEDKEASKWTSKSYSFWWMLSGTEDVDNLGLSRCVQSPRGPLKVVLCVECNYGPVGYQLDDDQRLYLACNLLHQQDAADANTASDFPMPEGLSLEMLQGLIAAGMAVVQCHVTFEEQRLGMCLADSDDGKGVEVVAFTDMGDGSLGPAEASGQVHVGDKLARVNGESTAGLDYGGVLDLVVNASRPVTIHFERKATAPLSGEAPVEIGDQGAASAVPRVLHQQWDGHKAR